MMKKGQIIGAFAGLLASATLAAAAAADIKGFNAAVKAGDYKTAASEAEATWKTWDMSDPQTALLAREFGFAALVAGRNDLARDFGRFLMEKGATLATPDDQPRTSAVLFRAADYKLNKGDGQRNALRDALSARNDAPGVDMTSVLSWELLYAADWEAADWEDAISDARLAAAYFAREKSLLVRQRKAELQSVSAEFVSARGRVTQGRNELYNAMTDVNDAIVDDLDAAKSNAMKAELWPLKWKAEAWAIAIESYINSSYEQVGSNINTSLDARRLKRTQFAQYPETSAAPVCEGKFEGQRLMYPESKKFRGVGSMIVRLETDSSGKVKLVDLLAAVPNEDFVSNLVSTMKTWTFKPAANVKPGSCRLDSRNHRYIASFRLG
jgi:hypothetical protein